MREGSFRVYVQDILEAIRRIDDYLGALTFEEFSREDFLKLIKCKA
jgi:uncharacterized protein with HEPN domain